MSYSVNLLVFLIFLKILLVSTQEDNFTFLNAAGYRSSEHTMAKYIVSLQYSKFTKYFGSQHFCGGSIINSRTILTSAHCLWNTKLERKRKRTSIQIVAKTPNRLIKTQHTEVIKIKKSVIHPNFDPKTWANDIAIMYLESKIGEDGAYAQRVKPPDGPVKSGTKCTVIGWGKMFKDGPHSADAIYDDIYTLKNSKCKKLQKNFTKGSFCAGDLDDVEKDFCKDDSGGPLICNGKITGVLSDGIECDKMPSVYADVWYYRDWIFKVPKSAKNVNGISIFTVLLLQLLVWILN